MLVTLKREKTVEGAETACRRAPDQKGMGLNREMSPGAEEGAVE